MKEHSNYSAMCHISKHDDVKRKKKKKHTSHERKKDKKRHRNDHKRRRHRSDSVSSTSSSDAEQTNTLSLDLDQDDLWVEKFPITTSNATIEASVSNDKSVSTSSARSAWMLEAPEALEGFNVIEAKKAPPPIDEVTYNNSSI
jgi:hypothetical protein